MIKLVSDTIDKNDINHLIEWLSQDEIPKLTKGELTVQLEKKWANKIGTKYSVFVNSGSSSIFRLILSKITEASYKDIFNSFSTSEGVTKKFSRNKFMTLISRGFKSSSK
jgi:dTDP-4-amino-4,6-dideoxygalactose transaminase